MAPTTGTVCQAPVAVTPGAMVAGSSLTTGYRPNRNCSGGDLTPQIYYSVVVPAGNRSRIVITPATGAAWAPRLRTLTDCNATTCTATPSSGAGTNGAAVETTVTNSGTAPQTILFSVAATSGTATVGAYTVQATNSVIPNYTRTMITGGCDDLTTGATAVAPSGGWDDDIATATAALPFAFNFWGTAVSHYTVTSNGFMQLWTSSSNTGSTSAGNSAIPSSSTPNNYIAPFADDLIPISTTATGVRVATLGTGSARRFVVEWYGWDTYETTSANLRFQAKLFETTNVIETHACAMMGTDARVRGSSATVGIEDATGTLGSQASYNTADSVAPANAQRYTPNN